MVPAQLVTKTEAIQLTLALARAGSPFTEEDARHVLAWANGIRTEQAMLDLALAGHVALVVLDTGEVVLRKNSD